VQPKMLFSTKLEEKGKFKRTIINISILFGIFEKNESWKIVQKPSLIYHVVQYLFHREVLELVEPKCRWH
jgi:hypothetical protein